MSQIADEENSSDMVVTLKNAEGESSSDNMMMTDEEEDDALGPLRDRDLEAQMECLIAKSIHPEMFISGYDADDQGIEEAEDPDSPGEKFLKAAEDGDLNLLQVLEATNPTLVQYKDKDGYTAMHRAAYSDHPQIIHFLAGKGALVEKVTEDGWTPLHSACHWNSFKAVRELLNCNANVNAQTNGGQTPLHIASNQHSRECLIILLTVSGINVNLKNKLGDTPLDVAQRAGNANLFEIHDININKL